MFRITQDLSSGSDNLCLIEITYDGSHVLIICLAVFVSGSIFWTCGVCARCVGLRTTVVLSPEYAGKHRSST